MFIFDLGHHFEYLDYDAGPQVSKETEVAQLLHFRLNLLLLLLADLPDIVTTA